MSSFNRPRGRREMGKKLPSKSSRCEWFDHRGKQCKEVMVEMIGNERFCQAHANMKRDELSKGGGWKQFLTNLLFGKGPGRPKDKPGQWAEVPLDRLVDRGSDEPYHDWDAQYEEEVDPRDYD